MLRADGKQASGTFDGGIAIWDLDPQHWQRESCAIAGRNLTRSEWSRYLGALGPYHQTCNEFAAA